MVLRLRLILIGLGLALSACGVSPTSPMITPTRAPSATPSSTATATAAGEPTGTASPLPPPDTVALPTAFRDVAVRAWAFPGPEHYEGDVLTVVVQHAEDRSFYEEMPATVSIDGGAPIEVTATGTGTTLELRRVFDTTGRVGSHQIRLQMQAGEGEIDATYAFDVLPADQRPAQETLAEWHTLSIECCVLHTIAGTAAARDIEDIAEHVQRAADEFETLAGLPVEDRLAIYFIDRMWGNGGFGGAGEIVVSYTDRYYGPTQSFGELRTLVRHEMTHATALDRGGEDGSFPFNEGMATYMAGGHYKPEPIRERAAAAYDLGWSPGLRGPFQHELSYLRGAAIVAYLVERFGWEGVEALESYTTPDELPPLEWLDGALQAHQGMTLAEFEQDFIAWMAEADPGAQLDDLRVTVELQELRRQYQALYAPYPWQIFGTLGEMSFETPGEMALLIREPDAPENVALEVLIAHAQRAIIDGRYDDAEALIDAVRAALGGDWSVGPAQDMLDITRALAQAGYIAVEIDLQGDAASVQAVINAPDVITLNMIQEGEEWTISE